jgi:acyl-CoA hydrolase/ribosomal protein S18 acetylase RimI-like enzyme
MPSLTKLLPGKRLKQKLIDAEKLGEIIRPGSRVFISSGPATPVLSMRHLYESADPNFRDLEILQLTVPPREMITGGAGGKKFRFVSFSVGENIARAMGEGLLDVIPTTMAELPYLLLSGSVPIDVAIVQTSMPDNHGNLNLGAVNDVNRIAVQKAAVSIAEINPGVPVTHGETGIFLDQFDYVIPSEEPLLEYATPPYDETLGRIGAYIASLVEDGSIVSLSMGRFFDAVAFHLRGKKNLRVWTHIVSDWIIGLIESGAVLSPEQARGEAPVAATSCIGTRRLYDFINDNHYVSLLPLFQTSYQQAMPGLKKLVSVMNVNRIDVTGESVNISGRDLQITGYSSKLNFALAATHSRDGKVIVGLRSRDRDGSSNIMVHSDSCSNLHRDTLGSVRYVVTEFGIASIFGKPIRERVLSLLEIAHPECRQALFDEAKRAGMVFADQVYIADGAVNYPYSLERTETFRDRLRVTFRAIKPSDEGMMRRLYYHFSDEAKYLRYFTRARTMPHAQMQRYVSVDYVKELSIVGIVQERGIERIIAECRYSLYEEESTYETAFLVDEEFQGYGIASFMLGHLLDIARERKLERLSAFVLPENERMIAVLEKATVPPRVEEGGENLRFDFYP